MTRLCTLLGALLLTTSGCYLYDDDDPCDYGGAAPDLAYPELRNPETGVCEYRGGGGGGGGDCYELQEEAPALPIDWASCYSHCEGLEESNCQATSGCRAVYAEDASGQTSFYECWATAPSGPVQGACEGLSAHECSRYDSCSAVHTQVEVSGGGDGFRQALGNFARCQAEVLCSPQAVMETPSADLARTAMQTSSACPIHPAMAQTPAPPSATATACPMTIQMWAPAWAP